MRALRAAVGGEAAGYVHYGATSQDIVDTAAMLVSRRALELVLEDVARGDGGLRSAGRQPPRHSHGRAHAASAGAADDVREQGRGVARRRARGPEADGVDARNRLAVQLGGAAGTLAALGEHGPEVVRRMASELALEEPVLPWHTSRVRVAASWDRPSRPWQARSARSRSTWCCMAQTEVGELSEPAGEGRGGSSTLAHKRNPVGSTLALACARKAQASGDAPDGQPPAGA